MNTYRYARKTERQSKGSAESLPNCVFAPPGDGPRTMYGANASGGLVHIADSESGAGSLVCPDCGGALIGRKGSIRVHHFSHASGSDCTHAGETALHRVAKEIIASGRELLLPASEVAGLDGTEVLALADTVEDRGVAEFIQIQGITIGLQHAAGRVRQNLQGLHGEDDFQAATRMLRELEEISARRGYGKEFPRRALDAKLPSVKARLLEMVFGGYKTEYRKAMSDIRIRREPPGWVL